jgi:Domain of unknown function (DUF4397)
MSLRLKLLVGALASLVFATMAPGALAAAKVRVLHGAPDVPAVDVYVDGNKAVDGLEPLAATGYLELSAGEHDIAVRVAGSPAASKPALTSPVTLADGKSYTGYATGFLGDGSLRLGVLEDAPRAPFTRATLRVWHNSPDAPNVDVVVNGRAALTNVAYGTASAYLPLAAGTYDVAINLTGTTTSVFSGKVALERGVAYTAVAVGSAAQPATGAPFAVKVLSDATSGALVRVLHAAPNVPAVTVYVNGSVALKRVGTLKASGYLPLVPGTYDIAVALAGQPVQKAVLRTKLTVADKTRYTALARGVLQAKGQQKLQLAVQRDIVSAPAGKAAVRIWHLSPGAPRVDVYLNGKKALSRVPYKKASAYLTLAPGTYTVRVNVAGTRNVVLTKKVTTKAGRAYSAIALGSAGGNGAKLRVALLHDA